MQISLVLNLYLLLLVSTELEVLAALDRQLFAEFALGTFHLQYDLLRRLRLQRFTQ